MGTGRRIPDVAYVKEYFSDEMLGEFNAALEKDTLKSLFYIENTLSYCESCKEIKEGKALHFEIGNEEKVIYNVCPTCAKRLKSTEAELLCPNCGTQLQESMEGLWD